MILEMKERLDIEDKKVALLFENCVSLLRDELVCGNSMTVANFGSFEVKKKGQRISVNPATNQRMLVPPKLSVSFKPSINLRDFFKSFEK